MPINGELCVGPLSRKCSGSCPHSLLTLMDEVPVGVAVNKVANDSVECVLPAA